VVFAPWLPNSSPIRRKNDERCRSTAFKRSSM
jgi:hypothetical protein